VVTLAAVPVKDLANAKQRLVPLLSARERRELARSMIEDVLEALCGVPLDGVLVVTRDPEVIGIAHRFSVAVLEEDENLGHTEAVALAQSHAATAGADRFLTIPGDVPQVTEGEIASLLDACPAGPAAVFVPSLSGFGTNGALLAPPDAMPLKFGEPSFANHLAAARRRGIEPVVLSLPGLGLDIDGPEDIRALMEESRRTRTIAFLSGLKILQRLG
jgi:2-phospho-L-lactate guanylyltransferase